MVALNALHLFGRLFTHPPFTHFPGNDSVLPTAWAVIFVDNHSPEIPSPARKFYTLPTNFFFHDPNRVQSGLVYNTIYASQFDRGKVWKWTNSIKSIMTPTIQSLELNILIYRLTHFSKTQLNTMFTLHFFGKRSVSPTPFWIFVYQFSWLNQAGP